MSLRITFKKHGSLTGSRSGFPRRLRDFTATLVGHLAFVYGGRGVAGLRTLQNVFVLNEVLRRWKSMEISSISDVGMDRYVIFQHTATLVNDKIVILGGYNRDLLCREDVVVFDIAATRLVRVRTYGKSPGGMAGQSACCAPGTDRIIVYSGKRNDEGRFDTSLHEYSVDRARWRQLKSKGQEPPYSHSRSFICLKAHAFLLPGPSDDEEIQSDLVFVLDIRPITPLWTSFETKGRAPKRRFCTSLVYLQGRLVLFGGRMKFFSEEENERLNDYHALNLQTKSWEELVLCGNSPPPIDSHAALVSQSKMIVLGGMASELANLYEIELTQDKENSRDSFLEQQMSDDYASLFTGLRDTSVDLMS